MRAQPIRYSAGLPSRDPPPPRTPMAPQEVADAVNTVQAMTAQNWWNLLIAFLLGGFTSAMWTWREARRRPEWNEVISTFFVTGLLAVAFAAYLIDKIDTPMVIVISILCGFSGDSLIRIVVRWFKKLIEKTMDKLSAFFGLNVDPPKE